MICEPGTHVTTHFEIFNEELSRCDWYLLPVDVQLMYMVFLSNAQNPVKIASYGGISCSRSVLERVTNVVNSSCIKLLLMLIFDGVLLFLDCSQIIFILYDASQDQGIDNSKLNQLK